MVQCDCLGSAETPPWPDMRHPRHQRASLLKGHAGSHLGCSMPQKSHQPFCCWVRQLAGQFLRAQTINERSAHSPGSLGRDFDRHRFDEIGGTKPPEFAKLVASDFTSSRHALQGLGVNTQKRCGLFCVDQWLKTRITDCRDPSGWFLSEVHNESPVMGGPIRANPSSLASSNVGILSNDFCALLYSSQE